MKKVSLKELKQNLSQYAEEASQGEPIEVTKYNKPFLYLSGAFSPSLHIGSRVGQGTLAPAGKAASGGAYLKALLEDRDSDG